VLVAAAVLLVAATGATAQTPGRVLSPIETAVACAPPPTLDVAPEHTLHVIGTQDVNARLAYGSRDLLVIDGGTGAGVELGQQFYIRRGNRFGLSDGMPRHGARTVGWAHIVAVNESTAIAAFDHICAAVLKNDYLEPFVAPVVPPGVDRDDPTGEPDFTALGQVIGGNEDRSAMGTGDFVLIDRGTNHGVMPGQRFALYRNVRAAGLPLASVGELVVISTSPGASLTRITRARDAVMTGDFVAPRR
jgi:hypothetical protein